TLLSQRHDQRPGTGWSRCTHLPCAEHAPVCASHLALESKKRGTRVRGTVGFLGLSLAMVVVPLLLEPVVEAGSYGCDESGISLRALSSPKAKDSAGVCSCTRGDDETRMVVCAAR